MLFPNEPHHDWFLADGREIIWPYTHQWSVTPYAIANNGEILPDTIVTDIKGFVVDEKGRVLISNKFDKPLPAIFSQVVTISHDVSGATGYNEDVQYYNNGWLDVPAHTDRNVTLNLPPITISGTADYIVSFGTPDRNNNKVRIYNATAGVMRDSASGSTVASDDNFFTFPTSRVTYTSQSTFLTKAKASLETFKNLTTWQYYPREDRFDYFSREMAKYPLRNKGTGGTFPYTNVGCATSAFMRISSAQCLTRTLLTHEIDQTAIFSGTKLVSGDESRNCTLSFLRSITSSISFFGFCCNPSKPILATPSGTIGLEHALKALRAKGVAVKLRIFLVGDPAETDNPNDATWAARAPYFGTSPAPVAERTLAKTTVEISGVSDYSLPVLSVEPIELQPNRLYAFEVSISAGALDTHEEVVTDKGITADGYNLYSAVVQSQSVVDVAISTSATSIAWDFTFKEE